MPCCGAQRNSRDRDDGWAQPQTAWMTVAWQVLVTREALIRLQAGILRLRREIFDMAAPPWSRQPTTALSFVEVRWRREPSSTSLSDDDPQNPSSQQFIADTTEELRCRPFE